MNLLKQMYDGDVLTLQSYLEQRTSIEFRANDFTKLIGSSDFMSREVLLCRKPTTPLNQVVYRPKSDYIQPKEGALPLSDPQKLEDMSRLMRTYYSLHGRNHRNYDPIPEEWSSKPEWHKFVFYGIGIEHWQHILRYHDIYRKVPNSGTFLMIHGEGKFDRSCFKRNQPESRSLAETGGPSKSIKLDRKDPPQQFHPVEEVRKGRSHRKKAVRRAIAHRKKCELNDERIADEEPSPIDCNLDGFLQSARSKSSLVSDYVYSTSDYKLTEDLREHHGRQMFKSKQERLDHGTTSISQRQTNEKDIQKTLSMENQREFRHLTDVQIVMEQIFGSGRLISHEVLQKALLDSEGSASRFGPLIRSVSQVVTGGRKIHLPSLLQKYAPLPPIDQLNDCGMEALAQAWVRPGTLRSYFWTLWNLTIPESLLGCAENKRTFVQNLLDLILNQGKFDTTTAKEVNEQLRVPFAILTDLLNSKLLVESSVPFHEKWNGFYKQHNIAEQKDLFMVKTDLNSCFDRIDLERLYCFLSDLLTKTDDEDDEEERASTPASKLSYHTREYFKVSVDRQRRKRKAHQEPRQMMLKRKCVAWRSFRRTSGGGHGTLQKFESIAGLKHPANDSKNRSKRWPVRKSPQILVPFRVETENSPTALLETFKKLCGGHLGISLQKDQLYLQTIGIPQGLCVSSPLCELYLRKLESSLWSAFFGWRGQQPGTAAGDTILCRRVDDYLLLTVRRDVAEGFLRLLFDGSIKLAFNQSVLPRKTNINFDPSLVAGLTSNEISTLNPYVCNLREGNCNDTEKPLSISWCGLKISSDWQIGIDWSRGQRLKPEESISITVHPKKKRHRLYHNYIKNDIQRKFETLAVYRVRDNIAGLKGFSKKQGKQELVQYLRRSVYGHFKKAQIGHYRAFEKQLHQLISFIAEL